MNITEQQQLKLNKWVKGILKNEDLYKFLASRVNEIPGDIRRNGSDEDAIRFCINTSQHELNKTNTMNTLKLSNGDVIIDTFQNIVLQTKAEAMGFLINLGLDESSILEREERLTINTSVNGIIDTSFSCLVIDPGSEDYIYYID